MLFGYSLLLVVGGPLAGRLFAAFGFGPSGPADTAAVREYLNLPYMVLGVVLGHPTHALFNVPIAAALALPLARLRSGGSGSVAE